jgi:mono/diheme cytochrome c family protein
MNKFKSKFQSEVLTLLVAIGLSSTVSSDTTYAIEVKKSLPPVVAKEATKDTTKAEKSTDVLYVDHGKFKGQPASSKSREGAKFFKQNNCISCHSVEGKGGCLAPPLDGIGGRRSKIFVESRITNDQKAMARFLKLYPYAELLEHPRLPAVQAKDIASYLLTLSDLPGGVQISGHKVTKKTPFHSTEEAADCHKDRIPKVAEGRMLFNDRGCIVCHSIRNMGGHFAPAFDGISKRHDRQYVADRITAAEFFNQSGDNEYNLRGTVMPPSDLNPEQVESITDYLMSLP